MRARGRHMSMTAERIMKMDDIEMRVQEIIAQYGADSDEVARAFRDDAAHRFRHDVAQGACLAGC
ncbi:hypothetical protein B2M20_03040 [Nitrobacter vulgaris]|uniref:Uncharacterized protein n=1 Tax=Nitrobacter vulgaris TaxID=29421 RepID=A0A1V4I1M3_NITVU|nr:hypothetical protein B2M20_03040 [Nitrobacter vulgaris]